MTRQYNKKNRVVFKAYVVPNKKDAAPSPPPIPPAPTPKKVKVYISKFDALFYLFVLAMIIWSPNLIHAIGWGVIAIAVFTVLLACYWAFYKFVSKKIH